MEKMKILILFLALILFSCQKQEPITLESLLNEMVSMEEMARFPDPFYTCHQASSYDRRTVSPDSLNWFGNNDGYNGGNFDRIDTINGRIEKVMLDHQGPGVITRMWITSLDQRPVIRFYFDGANEAGFTIPAYDLTQIGIAGAGRGLAMPHTSYTKGTVGGSTSYFPVPYAKSCKITVEIPAEINKNPRYYQINYRSYEKGTQVETFSIEKALQARGLISSVNQVLLNGITPKYDLISIFPKGPIASGDSCKLELPGGQRAITEMKFSIEVPDPGEYGQIMRELILSVNFDGKQTIWVPLGDFTGGGMGAFPVNCWYLSSDGTGQITSRWLMPYKNKASLTLWNASGHQITTQINVMTKELKWDKQSLYFNTSWKQNTGLQLFHCNDDINKSGTYEWNFTLLKGRGVFKGDALTLYNHSKSWYGEGDEKIWVDGEKFPSHIGTGTEDYYNSSWAPVVVSHTPFGGATRADTTSSQGYNTWLRTRNLDGIPFHSKMQFDFELLSWFRGTADYSSTVYWYGDAEAHAEGTSGIDEAMRKLLPPIGK
jgi:hypothetical protein